MPYPYEILDVFTRTPLAGNPLAVVHADGLDDARMQAIAAEFNLSETIFLAPADGVTAAARIFTPARELPFAGHPCVGAAVALAARHGLRDVALRVPAGIVQATVADGRAAFDAPQLPTLFGEGLDPAPVARALGLPPEAMVAVAHAAVGPSFTIATVDTVERLGTIRLDVANWGLDRGFNAAFAVAADGPGRFRARMFAPEMGIVEDPATGSAAVAFAAVWVAAERPADGTHALAIRQGVEMGRASDIALEVEVAGGLLARVRLAGAAVKIAEGTLLI